VNAYLPGKKRSGLPTWVENNLQLLVIATLVFFLLFVLTLGSSFTSAPPPPVKHTGGADLDVVMGPIKTWEEGSTARLKGVRLKVQNRGQEPARDVVVTGNFRGVALQLTGKTQLVPGEISDYSIIFPLVILTSDRMEFTAECANCVPFGRPHR